MKSPRSSRLIPAILVFCAAAIIVAAQWGPLRSRKSTVAVGTPFPNVSGVDLKGRHVQLSDFKGKVTLVDFWATWCGPCLAELPGLRALYAEYHDDGFDVLAVSLDDERETLEAFVNDAATSIPWAVLFDGKAWQTPFVARLGIEGIPQTYLVDREGRLLAASLRGSELWRHVAANTNPDGPQPPDYRALLAKFEAAPPQERARLRSDALRFVGAFSSEAFSGLMLSMLQTPPKAEGARLAREIAEAALRDDPDPSFCDVAALASHHLGDDKAAVEHQRRLVATIAVHVREQAAAQGDTRMKDMDDALILVRVFGAADAVSRLALYEALAGEKERARQLLAFVPGASDDFARRARTLVE